MFTKKSFEVFQVNGLEARMKAIRAEIQPVFQEFWEGIAPIVSQKIGEEEYIHIAQHRRRSVHAPESTWSAISTNKRGYKSQPHFQLGIWKNYVFLYVSMIDQPKEKEKMAKALLENLHLLEELPKDYVYSKDHTENKVYSVQDAPTKAIQRLKDVKKGEFEIGKIIPSTSDVWENAKAAHRELEEIVKTLLPIYQLLYQVQKEALNEN